MPWKCERAMVGGNHQRARLGHNWHTERVSDGIDFADAERMLREAEFESVKTLWSSSNYVFLGQMCGGDGAGFSAIYKPHKGESPLWDFPDGLYQREVAAYELARLFEWPFVPPTIVRDGPHGIGSVQVFIPHDQRSSFFEQREDTRLVPQLKRMAVFDYVANNADRKGGHCLLDDSGIVWGIDHGLAFHVDYKLRSVIWDWADEPIPQVWLDDIARLAEDLAGPGGEAESFRTLIDAGEVAATVGRIRKLLASGKFPMPGPHRHYPWPLV